MNNYKDYGYRSNKNVVYKCHFHVVWCPKYRRKVLHSGVDVRLKELVHEVCKELDCPLTELEVCQTMCTCW